MATQIYQTEIIETISGIEIELKPLKIKYLRQFMDMFADAKNLSDNYEVMDLFSKCAFIGMQQYFPSIKTIEHFEDEFGINEVYKILDIGAGIKINKEKAEEEKNLSQQAKDEESSWENLDLVKLESEVFLLGIWKDYEDLELSLSMPELIALLASKRELDYEEKKFLAAIQGIDLDKNSGKQNAWEDMKARVFSGGKTSDSNDILALQGPNAAKVGFGIGNGLSYETWD